MHQQNLHSRVTSDNMFLCYLAFGYTSRVGQDLSGPPQFESQVQVDCVSEWSYNRWLDDGAS